MLFRSLQTAILNRRWTVVGLSTMLCAAGYRRYKEEERLRKESKKKKVLVLPFYKMKIVEEKKSNPNTILSNLTNFVDKGGDDKVIEMQADELVSLIRASAEDPKIVSIFGIFGISGK